MEGKAGLKYRINKYFIIVSILPIIVLGLLSYYLITNSVVDKFLNRTTAQITSNVAGLDDWFARLESTLYNLSTDYDTFRYFTEVNVDTIETPDIYQLVTILSTKSEDVIQLNNNHVDFIILIPTKEGGYPMYKGDYILGNSKITMDALGITKAAMENKEKVIWDRIYNASKTEAYDVGIKATIDPYSEQVVGVCILGYNVNSLNSLMQNIVNTDDEFAFFLDREGGIVQSSRHDTKDIMGANEDLLNMLQSTDQSNFDYRLDGELYRFFVCGSSTVPLKFVYAIPRRLILGDIRYMPYIILAVGMVLLVYIAIMSRRMYKDIYMPIHRLYRAMREFSYNNLGTKVDQNRWDELGLLTSAFNDMGVKITDLVKEVEVKERSKKRLEIQALQAQITPHFLYNTLNSVKALARLKRSDNIIQMVESLILLLRVSAQSDTELITVEEEMEYTSAYITIMNFRYDQSIKAVYEVNDNIRRYRMPKFTIQPIVENAIIHGFEGDDGECRLLIKASVREGMVWFEIMDNGVGMDGDTIAKIMDGRIKTNKYSSIGLPNIDQRLKLNFGETYGLAVESKEGQGTKIIINMPIMTEDTLGEP